MEKTSKPRLYDTVLSLFDSRNGTAHEVKLNEAGLKQLQEIVSKMKVGGKLRFSIVPSEIREKIAEDKGKELEQTIAARLEYVSPEKLEDFKKGLSPTSSKNGSNSSSDRF